LDLHSKIYYKFTNRSFEETADTLKNPIALSEAFSIVKDSIFVGTLAGGSANIVASPRVIWVWDCSRNRKASGFSECISTLIESPIAHGGKSLLSVAPS